MQPAPIALFAFNRPEHLKRTLAALAANDLASESDLHVFCDGPRNAKDAALCAEVVTVAQEAIGFKSVAVVRQEKNKGLAPSVIAGVSQIVAAARQVIVLEDDLVTSPYFLRYMNDALMLYADDPNVASIHGWCFPHNVPNPPQTFFLRGADCWGWATWKRAWDIFEPDAGKLLTHLRQKNLITEFDIQGSYGYSSMLEQAAKGEISSWAIRWHASTFLADMYTLHPGNSLVHNIGLDNSGTHCSTTQAYDTVLAQHPVTVIPQPVKTNMMMQQAQKEFYKEASGSRKKAVIGKVKKIVKDYLPPALLRSVKKILAPKNNSTISWQGNYPNWQSACAACGNDYSSEAIFARVLESARAVRDGKALWERDSVLFYHEEYNWPLVACLMNVAAQHNGRLHVLDFGGALGSTYQQNRQLLDKLPDVSWSIVEQEHIVRCGQKEFTTNSLKFYHTMDSCLEENPINVILFSSVLQYMPEPYTLLQKAIEFSQAAILIDRTPFMPRQEKITIQHTPEDIYAASYPCRWLNREHVASLFATNYTCLPDYESHIAPPGFYGFMALRKKP